MRFLGVVLVLAGSTAARAGVKVNISDDTNVDLGFRLQTQFLYTDDTGVANGVRDQEFNVRRARIRFGGDVTRWVSFFLQTEAADDAGSGLDMRVIDAWVSLNLSKAARVYLGEHMAPASRQIVTSSGGLLAIDRPNIINYNLTWGLNGRYRFNNTNLPDGNLNLSGETNVRDEGATLFGAYSLSSITHLKYYLGAYDGIQTLDEDKERYTARVQFNLFDPEPGYYNLSTYLDTKKTIGIGGSYDTQESIAADALLGAIDYQWWTVDLFTDWPAGPGAVTFEWGYQELDLQGAPALNVPTDGGVEIVDARRTEGSGWYVQAGYLISGWRLQPWGLVETWESEAPDGLGGFSDVRIGLSYFFKGHNANVKLGYEYFEADQPIGAGAEDTVETFLIGFYVTY